MKKSKVLEEKAFCQWCGTNDKRDHSKCESLRNPLTTIFAHDQLLQALYWAFDFMDRAMINFYLVGSTAESVKNQKDLFGDKINIAVRKNEWASGAKNIADAFAVPLKEAPTKVEYEYQGVPIILHVLEDNEMLTSADSILYASEVFRLPNPYDKFVEEFSWLN